MAQPSEQFGQDLSAVHSFYLYLLESAMGHEVPVPPSIAHDGDVLLRFLLLLDMAVTPQMIRDGLKGEEHKAWAEALLRFFAQRPKRRREDRDKLDVVSTALYRIYVPEEADEPAEAGDFQRTMRFEEDLRKIYQGIAIAEPPNEHLQLVREFQFLRDEVMDFRHFDELIDSGVIQKVREIKQSLDASFLHPSVLAPIGSYNVFFGQKFDMLFKRATKEVKTFAAKVQEDGGSIMSRVDGDVIVKHLAEVDEGKILTEEYSRAQENLRHVSRLKKAVDNRRYGKVQAPPPKPTAGKLGAPPLMGLSEPAGPSAAAARAGSAPLGPPPPLRPTGRLGPAEPAAYAIPRSSSSIADVELEKIHAVQMAIRGFVRASNSNSAQVVPLPFGNVSLSQAEVDAFRADYGNEKSFRADLVATLMQMAAVEARMHAELLDFEKTKYTDYNWKPHADALAHLLTAARGISESAMALQAIAQQRGLTEKVTALTESFEKVRTRARVAADALQSIG